MKCNEIRLFKCVEFKFMERKEKKITDWLIVNEKPCLNA